jgi:hypothetical protein
MTVSPSAIADAARRPTASKRLASVSTFARGGCRQPAGREHAIDGAVGIHERHPLAELPGELVERGMQPIGTQSGERHRSLCGQRPRVAGVRLLGQEIGRVPGHGDEGRSIRNLEQRDAVPHARVRELGRRLAYDIRAETERGDAGEREPVHVTVVVRRAAGRRTTGRRAAGRRTTGRRAAGRRPASRRPASLRGRLRRAELRPRGE